MARAARRAPTAPAAPAARAARARAASEDTGGGDAGAGGSGGGSDGGSGGGSGGGSDADGSGDGSGDGAPARSGAGSGGGSGDGSGGGSPDSGADPDDGSEVTYPELGLFGITSVNPTRVNVAGGTLVTITGTALPINAAVRVGDAAAATVVRSSATELVFRAPARAEGSYWVHVFARDGRVQTMPDPLVYVPDGAAGGGSGTDDGSDDGADDGSDSTGGGSGGTGGGSGDDSDGSDEGSDGSDGGTGGSAAPVVRTGPNGERLVRTSKFAALGSIWSMNCSVSCTGVAI